MKCTEQVRQEKLGKDDKVELKEDSTYDYLVILTNAGGELNLSESRIPVHEAKTRSQEHIDAAEQRLRHVVPRVPSALCGGLQVHAGRARKSSPAARSRRVSFQHIPGMKSAAALALRGREYPLELSGTAWIDPQTGSIAKIEAGIADTLQDVGLKTLISEIDFAPVPFPDSKQLYWFPTQARVEVETPKQHWRNLHQFTAYKKFSVSTEEQVIQK